ncbi:MAG: segregation and condensation protein A [Pseudohongiellaceae bacterium]|jgi:segregation and condensation protein A
MSDQVFELENFRGPLDLLLHLIREQELDIAQVNLSKVCDQYLTAIKLMEAVDINVAGEFLVLASTLVLIKSRAILPREEEINLEEELDPGDELIQQLLEYRKYKTLSIELGRRADERVLRHGRGQRDVPADEQNELAEVELWDLVGSFVRLMEEIGLNRQFDTLKQEKPLRAYLRETLACLGSRNRWSLKELVMEAGSGDGLFGYFLSLLELVKTRQVNLLADGSGGDVIVELREDRDESRLSFIYEDEPVANAVDPRQPVEEPEPSADLAPRGEQGIVADPSPPSD